MKDKTKWQKFEDYVGVFFLGCCLLLLIATMFGALVIILEEPINLLILCVTMYLFYVEWKR